MKKAYSFRLSNEAITVIRIKAKENGCSEASVVEGWANTLKVGKSHQPDVIESDFGHINMPKPISGIAPKGSFSKEDLKALISGGRKGPEVDTTGISLVDHPRAPFDLNIEGEPHRVAQMGKAGLWLFYLSEDGNRPVRPIAEGELEKLWEKRIK